MASDQINNPIPIINTVSTTELVSGTYHSRPRNRKLKSPGSLPKPTFSSQPRSPLKTRQASTKTINQRIDARRSQPVHAVTRCKAQGHEG